MEQMKKIIEELLIYAKEKLLLNPLDETYFRNWLMHELNTKNVFEGDIDDSKILALDVPDYFVDNIKSLLIERGFNQEDAEKKVIYILGMLSPLPSIIEDNFFWLNEVDPQRSSDYFYNLCVSNYYVRKSMIDLNVFYKSDNKYHNLIAEINLSKPEKSNKDIANALKQANDGENYPKCAICEQNVGCFGSSKTPQRNNLRVIPMTLNNKKWFMQYSPYGYFNEHCIVLSSEHEPMKVCGENLGALFDFVDILPHYFIGSNSDLPIVGGSILTHEHFQGGRYDMPLFKAKEAFDLKINLFPRVRGWVLDYPGTIFKFTSDDKASLVALATRLLKAWQSYDNDYLHIVSKNHNTMTTIVNKVNDEYNLYIALRNNITTEECPDGLFHARKKYHHIKKEGIGIVEISGIFVLPARLKRQLSLVNEVLQNPSKTETILEEYPDLVAFNEMIEELKDHKYSDVNEYLFNACHCMLEDIDVFKFDKQNCDGLKDFLKKADL